MKRGVSIEQGFIESPSHAGRGLGTRSAAEAHSQRAPRRRRACVLTGDDRTASGIRSPDSRGAPSAGQTPLWGQAVRWKARRGSCSWGAYTGAEVVGRLSDEEQGRGARCWPIVTVGHPDDHEGGPCSKRPLRYYHVGITWDHRSVVLLRPGRRALTLSS